MKPRSVKNPPQHATQIQWALLLKCLNFTPAWIMMIKWEEYQTCFQSWTGMRQIGSVDCGSGLLSKSQNERKRSFVGGSGLSGLGLARIRVHPPPPLHLTTTSASQATSYFIYICIDNYMRSSAWHPYKSTFILTTTSAPTMSTCARITTSAIYILLFKHICIAQTTYANITLYPTNM